MMKACFYSYDMYLKTRYLFLTVVNIKYEKPNSIFVLRNAPYMHSVAPK